MAIAGEATLTFGQGSYQRPLTVAGRRLIAAVVVLAGAAAFLLIGDHSSVRESLVSLVSASNLNERSLEPRLSGGFAWAPFRPGSRESEYGSFSPSIGTTLASV